METDAPNRWNLGQAKFIFVRVPLAPWLLCEGAFVISLSGA